MARRRSVGKCGVDLEALKKLVRALKRLGVAKFQLDGASFAVEFSHDSEDDTEAVGFRIAQDEDSDEDEG